MDSVQRWRQEWGLVENGKGEPKQWLEESWTWKRLFIWSGWRTWERWRAHEVQEGLRLNCSLLEGKSPEAGEDLEARKCLSSLATSVAESKMGSPPSVASVFPVIGQPSRADRHRLSEARMRRKPAAPLEFCLSRASPLVAVPGWVSLLHAKWKWSHSVMSDSLRLRGL